MNKQRVAELIRVHLDRYPESHIADVYKLLHQAVFGLGHLVANKKAAREWLENEAGKVTPTHEDLLVESVHPEAAIVRLHLRPYLAYGGKIKPLVDAMARSAEHVQGDPHLLSRWWRVFETMCQLGEVRSAAIDPREVKLFGRMRECERWPNVQHSPPYFNAYQPVYRVLSASEAEVLCKKLGVMYSVSG